MTEKGEGIFVIHWTQDKRENASGRGCHHQGVSSIRYLEDKDSCYTATRKVCSDCLACVFRAIPDTHFTRSRTAFHGKADTVSR